MDELMDDRSEACSACVEVHGLRVGVRTNVPGLLEDVPLHLPVGWKTLPTGCVDCWYGFYHHDAVAGESSPRHVLEVSGRPLVHSEDLSEVWQRFEYELDLDVAERSPKYVFLHAGVVGWRGQALLIPGRSHSGKSTLVAALCQAGADYYSDEYALLDRRGRVHPYPRPLRLRQPVPHVSAPTQPECEAAHGRPPLPVGLVVVTRHEHGADWRPTQLSPGQSILEVLHHALSVQRQPGVVLAVLRQALAGARTVRGPRGEAKETAERLLRWVAVEEAM